VTAAGKARLRVSAVILVTLYLEVTFGSNLRIWGVAPDLLGLITITAALAAGPEVGAFSGFACGLLTDLYLQDTPLGLSALCLCLVGYLVGTFRLASPNQSRLLVPPLVLVAAAVDTGLFLALAGVFGQAEIAGEGRNWLIRVVVIQSLDAAVLSLPVLRLLRWAVRGSQGALAVPGPVVIGR
jgi:rod shape-determining protein MreD